MYVSDIESNNKNNKIETNIFNNDKDSMENENNNCVLENINDNINDSNLNNTINNNLNDIKNDVKNLLLTLKNFIDSKNNDKYNNSILVNLNNSNLNYTRLCKLIRFENIKTAKVKMFYGNIIYIEFDNHNICKYFKKLLDKYINNTNSYIRYSVEYFYNNNY